MTPFTTAWHCAAAVTLTLLAAATTVSAAEPPAKPLTGQQSKMGACNTAAAGKTGDERKAFMSDCLKNKPVVAAKPTQREKMAQCNKDSTGKKGDDRKAFMSSCLKAA